jgi:hypothetical protein
MHTDAIDSSEIFPDIDNTNKYSTDNESTKVYTTDTTDINEKKTEEKIEEKIETTPEFEKMLNDEMEKREKENLLFGNMGIQAWRDDHEDEHTFDARVEKQNIEITKFCESIIKQSVNKQGKEYIDSLFKIIYSGDLSRQCVFIPCPQGIHHGPFMDEEDRYHIIFGESSDKKIVNEYTFENTEMSEKILGTNITKGMMQTAKGERWKNGLIAYNKNSIIVRDNDNGFGQPGFLSMVCFYNKIGIEIMKRYIIPTLIRDINNKNITTYSKSEKVHDLIINTYKTVLKNKMEIIDGPDKEFLTESILFFDEPSTETVNKSCEPQDEKDKRISELEKIIKLLEFKITSLTSKIAEIEENILDIGIKVNKISSA